MRWYGQMNGNDKIQIKLHLKSCLLRFSSCITYFLKAKIVLLIQWKGSDSSIIYTYLGC